MRLLRLALVPLLLGTLAPAALAQLVRLTPGGGELGVESRGAYSGGGRQPVSWESYLSTWVNLPVSGAIFSPRFFTYSAAVRPTRIQQTMGTGDGRFELHTLGLSLGVNLLAAAPVSLSVHTDRTSAQSPREAFGAITAYRNGTSGALIRVRLPAFPLRVEWSARDQADEWRAAPDQAPIRRDETLEVFRVAGESSKLTTLLERQRFVDRIGTLDFVSTVATAQHAIRWGQGSSLVTLLEANAREGREAQQRQLIGERLHLRHSRAVGSDLSVHRQRSRSGSLYRSDITTTALAVQADPTPGLSTNLAASYTATALGNGRLRMAAASPSVALRRDLGGRVRFAGQFGLNYQRTDQSLEGELATPVTDESHQVGEARQFTLRHERVELTSIVVYHRDRSTVYLEGTDYRVTALGELARIEVPLVSRIQVGDELRISYLFAPPSVRAHDLRGMNAMVSFGRDGLSFSQSALMRRAQVLAGDPNAGLEGGDDFVTALDLRRALFGGAVSANAQHRLRRNARADFTASELRVGFQPRPRPTNQSHLGASFAHSSAGEQVATMIGANLSNSWQPRTGWQLVTAAESQRWQFADGAVDRTTVMSVDLTWRAGRIESEWRYVWQQRSTLQQFSQHRLFARVLRRF